MLVLQAHMHFTLHCKPASQSDSIKISTPSHIRLRGYWMLKESIHPKRTWSILGILWSIWAMPLKTFSEPEVCRLKPNLRSRIFRPIFIPARNPHFLDGFWGCSQGWQDLSEWAGNDHQGGCESQEWHIPANLMSMATSAAPTGLRWMTCGTNGVPGFMAA